MPKKMLVIPINGATRTHCGFCKYRDGVHGVCLLFGRNLGREDNFPQGRIDDTVPLRRNPPTGAAAAKYLGKGSMCYIEGRLQTRSWDDKDGKKQYITEVVAKDVVFLSRKEAKGGDQPTRQQPPQRDDGAEDNIPF